MSKKRLAFEGELFTVPKEIIINVNKIDKGLYTLKIIHKNKIIKQTTFIK